MIETPIIFQMYSDSQDEKSSEDAWYYDKRYARFWHHYNTMMMTAHRDAVVRARHIASHTNTALSGMVNRPLFQYSVILIDFVKAMMVMILIALFSCYRSKLFWDYIMIVLYFHNGL